MEVAIFLGVYLLGAAIAVFAMAYFEVEDMMPFALVWPLLIIILSIIWFFTRIAYLGDDFRKYRRDKLMAKRNGRGW